MRIFGKRNPRKKRRQAGQMIIEAVLILALVVFFFKMLQDQVLGDQWAQQLIQSPFEKLAGMIENGVLGTPEETRAEHPNHQKRQLSYLGDSGGA